MTATRPRADDDLRPARETPRLKLPIPGDAGPADYVTDTGAIADRLDGRLGVDSIRHTGTGWDLPDVPIGARVVIEVPADSFMAPELAENDATWQLQYAGEYWWFIGGSPLMLQYSDELVLTGNGAWQALVGLALPYSGWYECDFGAMVTTPGAGSVLLMLNRAGVEGYPAGQGPTNPVLSSSAGGMVSTLHGKMQFHGEAGDPLVFYSGSPTTDLYSPSYPRIAIRPMWIHRPGQFAEGVDVRRGLGLPPLPNYPPPDDWPSLPKDGAPPVTGPRPPREEVEP